MARSRELTRFRASLNVFSEAAQLYLKAEADQKELLIHGAQLYQALQLRAGQRRAEQAREIDFAKTQRSISEQASTGATASLKDSTTSLALYFEKSVAAAAERVKLAIQEVDRLETKIEHIRAARLQGEILGMNAEIEELEALAAAEEEGLKPAKDHVDIQGALLRRAIANEERRVKDEIATFDANSAVRQEELRGAATAKKHAERDELDFTKEQSGLRHAEDACTRRRQILVNQGRLESVEEPPESAVERWNETGRIVAGQLQELRESREAFAQQGRQYRIDAGNAMVKRNELRAQIKTLNEFIDAGLKQAEHLALLPAILNAVESDRGDPYSPSLPGRLQDVVHDSAREVSRSDVRLAELRATRQAIEETGVAGYNPDVHIVVEELRRVGRIKSARPFNEYLAKSIPDAEKARELVLSDPARYLGVCVAQSEFELAQRMTWDGTRPNKPVVISIASLDRAAALAGQSIVPPADDSAFSLGAAQALSTSLEAKLRIEEERRDAYAQRHAATLRALQELATFLDVYGEEKMKETRGTVESLVQDEAAASQREQSLTQLAEGAENQADECERQIEPANQRRIDAAHSVEALREFIIEHETGRPSRLSRLEEIDALIMDAHLRKELAEDTATRLQNEQNTDYRLKSEAEVLQKSLAEDRGKIEYYSHDYPAQEQLAQKPRTLDTLRRSYNDARDAYNMQASNRLGALHEKIKGKRDQKLGKTHEYARDFAKYGVADTKPFLYADHGRLIAETQREHGPARAEQIQASAAGERLKAESAKFLSSSQTKANLRAPTPAMQTMSFTELAQLSEECEREYERASNQAREAAGEATKAEERGQRRALAADSDQRAAESFRVGVGLPENPDPALIAAEISGALGVTVEVPAQDSFFLHEDAHAQTMQLQKQWGAKGQGVAKLKETAGLAFDQVKKAAALQAFREIDPTVSSEMENNSFAAACTDADRLLEHLDDRISTTDATLAKMQEDFDLCVEDVLGVVKNAIHTLNQASGPGKCVPREAPYVGGKQVLKMRANFGSISADLRRQAIHAYLEYLGQSAVVPVTGTDLVADALLRINGKPLGLQVLKFSIEETEQYVPVEKISNSGGEGVVMAMFLYLLINQLRAENHAQLRKNGGGPLLLDNPFAKATSAPLWRAQRALAKAMNVQLIFATAQQDFNTIGEFRRFIRLRRVGQNTKTRRWQIEIAPLQLIDPQEPMVA
ncbi:hypothetical protein [Variovorax sp. dw_308]|uniref:hypothetical protein n=1 Tax=Variovorax sp. dw_308 TaxID=2721546 RepID=UPI001C467829|nr:hypothetical protein [Variovorax sp. dw_308]